LNAEPVWDDLHDLAKNRIHGHLIIPGDDDPFDGSPKQASSSADDHPPPPVLLENRIDLATPVEAILCSRSFLLRQSSSIFSGPHLGNLVMGLDLGMLI
jgi:hypothetical protein